MGGGTKGYLELDCHPIEYAGWLIDNEGVEGGDDTDDGAEDGIAWGGGFGATGEERL